MLKQQLLAMSCAALLQACSSDHPQTETPSTRQALKEPGDRSDKIVVRETEVIGGFVGGGAALHPDNTRPEPLAFYGTDLGFSYRHNDRIEFLFGDSWSVEGYAPIEASSGAEFDDSFGSVALSEFPDGRSITPDNIPILLLGQKPGTNEASAINPGHAMDLGKTPMGGFSAGTVEWAIFNLTKPQACQTDADCGDLSCATGLGTFGAPIYEQAGLTLPCPDGSPFCVSETIPDPRNKGSGVCIDPTSFPDKSGPFDLVAANAMNVRIGRRDKDAPKRYVATRDWLTSKFSNVAIRGIRSWAPGSKTADYSGTSEPTASSKVFLWGRPGFVGNKAKGRPLNLYFAYSEIPNGLDDDWSPQYFAGLNPSGEPTFVSDQTLAEPLDLNSELDGFQSEQVDIVNQMSVIWEPHLEKWVMFYGGGLNDAPSQTLPLCGVLQLFAGAECGSVDVGNGSIRMRFADHPWGPWSPPQDLIGGDPHDGPIGQYGPAGLLRHTECTQADCADHTDTPETLAYREDEIGFFYAPNIVEEWTVADEDGVTLTWNVSTWDPYRVALLKTRLRRTNPGD